MTKLFLKTKTTILAILVATIFTFSTSSCTDVDKTLGLGFIPDDQQVTIVIDTLYPSVYNVSLDSIICNNISMYPFGSYYDPIFGTTNAGLAFQMAPFYDSLSFGTSPVVDSVVMFFVVPKIQGENAYSQTLSMYELSQAISIDSIYYPGIDIKNTMIDPTPIGTTIYERNVADRWDTSYDTLNFKIDASIGQRIADMDSTVFYDDTTFIKAFKGFYLATDEVAAGAKGRINYIDASNSYIYMTIHFQRNGTDTSFLFYNNINSVTAVFSDVKHNYATATDPLRVSNLSSLNDTTSTVALDSTLYIQGLYGVAPLVKVRKALVADWLASKNLKANELAVSKAELEFDVELYDDFKMSEYSDSIGLFYKSYYSSGDSTEYPYSSSITEMNSSLFGGSMNKTYYKYPFKVTYDFTSMIKKFETANDFVMFVSPFASITNSYGYETLIMNQSQMYKSLLKGSSSSRPPRLIITYSRPKQ